MPTNTGQSLPAPGAGEVVAARVVSQRSDGTTQLSLAKGQQIEVRLPVTLAAGTNVALQVQEGGAQPRVALMVDGQGQPVTPDVARAALAASQNAGTGGTAAGQAAGQAASVPRPAVQVPTFTPGDVLSAEVLGQTGNGATRLNVGRTMLDARLPEPLAEGTRTVALKVEAGGTQPRLAVVVDGDGRPASLEAVRTQAANGQLRTGPSFTATPSASAQTAGATSTQPDPAQALATLKTGDLVNAKVIRQEADGTTRLSLGRTQVEVRLPVALKEGATVSLRVAAGPPETGAGTAGSQPTVRLGALIDPQNQPLSGDVARMANAARAQSPVQTTFVSGPKALPPAGSIVAAQVLPAASDGTPQIAIGKTVVKAPLGSLPEPGSNVLVKIASNGSAAERPQISLLTNRQGAPVNGGTTNALASARQTMSGEVRLVRAPVLSAVKPTTSPEALDRAVNEARPLAASRQDSMAPLFANAAVASGKSSPLPQVLQQVVRDVLGFRLPADGMTGEQVRVAAGRSGLFNEAQTAAAKVASTKADSASGQIRPAASGPAPQSAPSEPAKARAPVAAEAVALPDTLQALVNASLQGGGKADLKSTLFLLRAVLSGFLGDEADLPQPPRAGTPPPPPRAGGQPQGQQPAQSGLPDDAGPKQTARMLLSDTEAALSRIRLSQIASQPSGQSGGTEASGAHGRPGQAAHWTFEIPLTVSAGTAMAQFQIFRDEEGGGSGYDQPEAAGWRLHFALDLSETGAVESLVALGGQGTTVTLWAQRPDVAAALREGADELSGVLELAGIDVASVRIRHGLPAGSARGKAAPSGYFLDRRT